MTLALATDALAAVLEQENAALLALDFAAAARFLLPKQHALTAFSAAQPSGVTGPGMAQAAARLKAAADENKRLLQRAMAVQTRVMGVLAGAARQTQPVQRYGRGGALAAATRTAWALSASA